MSYLKSTAVLVVGFLIGWMGRGVWFPDDQPVVLENRGGKVTKHHPGAIAQTPAFVSRENTDQRSQFVGDPEPFETAAREPEWFVAYLNSGNYNAAMDLFQRSERNASGETNRFKEELLSFLNMLLESQNNSDFTELTDLYLSAYFNDIDVLLMLADFNTNTEFYIDAVGIYHLAFEYAHNIVAREKVSNAFSAFLQKVDKHLVVQGDWYSLSQIYLQADIVGVLSPAQRLRYAVVTIENGDFYHGKQILEQLLANREVSQDARTLLATLSDEDNLQTSQPPEEPGYASAVDLERRGNQYLIDIGLGRITSRLLIDTGASLTTLSRSAFERVAYNLNATQMGSRMFSTANGVTKGSVYRVVQLILGDFELRDVMLAVLDFEMGSGVDGLLGMNVLGSFKFQIEQDTNQLLLTPR